MQMHFKGYARYVNKNMAYIEINQIDMIKKKFSLIENVNGIFKVENCIHSRRDNGLPKYCPLIAVDFINTNTSDALAIIKKIILDGVITIGYSTIILDFSSNLKKIDLYKIANFTYELASIENYHSIFHTRKHSCELYFTFVNDNYYSDDYELMEEEEEEEEEEESYANELY